MELRDKGKLSFPSPFGSAYLFLRQRLPRVLASQANHQILDLWIGARPARAARFAAVEFLNHQLAIPGENGIGFGEARDLSFAP